MPMPIDTKKKLQSIVESIVDAHVTNKSNAKYDITKCAKAMVDEAYAVGLGVKEGKIPEPAADEEEPVKKKKSASAK